MTQLLLVIGKKKNNIIRTQFTYYKNGSSFDYKAASLYSVAIHEDGDLLSLGYINSKTGDIYGVEQFQLDHKKPLNRWNTLFSDNEVKLKLTNGSKNTYYSTTSKFTIVPSLFFDPSKTKEILSGVVSIDKGESVFSNFIPEIDSHIIFSIREDLKSLFQSKIGHTKFSHHWASLISTYHLYYVSEDIKSVFVQYHQNKFSLCLYAGKKLIQFNTFDFKTPEDIIYYIYYTMEQFGFTPKESVIHLGGNYADHNAVTTTLQRYTEKIFHLKPNCCNTLSTEKSDAIINTIFDLQCG